MISENLKKLRGVHHLTQEDASKIAGVSKPTYLSWEYGRTTPPATGVIKLADHYGVSLDYLYGRHIQSHEMEITDQEKDLLDLWGRLSERERLNVLFFITKLAGNVHET